MMGNSLADFTADPMSDRHFEITNGQLADRNYPLAMQRAVKAALVNRVAAPEAAAQFNIPPDDLLLALQTYTATWVKYCADNDLVIRGFWLPADMVSRVKAIETRALNRAERRLKEKALEKETQAARASNALR